MNRLYLALPLALLAACNSEAAPPPPANETAAPAKAGAQKPEPDMPPVEGGRIVEKSDLVAFNFSWPAEAAAIPTIHAEMQKHAAEHLKNAREGAVQDQKARAEIGAEPLPFAFDAKWENAGESDRLLSLMAKVYEFTGGAHGNTHYDVLLWDKATKAKVAALDLFADRAAAARMINETYCPLLDRQRAEKRQETLPLKGEGWMVECPDAAKYAIAPVDKNGDGRFDALRVLLPPYEAGPYAEGTFEVDVPVTGAVKAMMKPDYRSAF